MQAESNALPRLTIKPIVYLLAAVFILAALLYAVLSTGRDPAVVLSIFATRFRGIFIEAVPFLLLGTLTSGLIETFVRPDDIARLMPKNKFAATLSGAFLGFAFPVCECGVVPVTRRLYTKGLPVSVGIAFLLAAPVMNPIVFASTYIAFGFGPVLIGRFVLTAIVAVSVGLIFALTTRPHEVLQPASMCDVDAMKAHEDAQARPGLLPGLARTLGIAVDEFFEMGRFLILGSLLAAAMQTLVPQETLLTIGEGPVISVIAMQILAFVLSVCSTVDSFLALAFINTFTTGAILAFLSFGPMVDIKSTMMFMGVFKRRTVLYLIWLPFVMNLFFGVFVNVVLLG